MRSRIPSSPAARDVLAKLIPSMGVISANEPPSAIADLIAAFAALRISLVPPKSENWNTNESPRYPSIARLCVVGAAGVSSAYSIITLQPRVSKAKLCF